MNFNIILKILREGILAALMGGFYIDFSENAHFINIVHIYLWLFLFGMPIIIVMDYSNSISAIIITSVGVGLLVLIIKLITNRLHFLFDVSEAIEYVKKDGSSKDDDNIFCPPFSAANGEAPKASAIDQESMFHGGSIEDIESAQIHREASKIGVSGDASVMPPVPDAITTKVDNQQDAQQQIQQQQQQQQQQQPEEFNESNMNGGNTSDLCILEQVSRRPSLTRPIARISSARYRIIDSQRKGSFPVVPSIAFNAAGSATPSTACHKTNICLSERYPKLVSHRSNIDYCRNEMKKMNEEISKLNIRQLNDFEPSTSDIALLDSNQTTKKVVKSISRSRSSSQRYCHSVHLHQASAARVGSMRAGMLAKLSPPPPPPPSSQQQQGGRKHPTALPFRRRQSLSYSQRQQQHQQQQSQQNPPNSQHQQVMRSQSMRTHHHSHRFAATAASLFPDDDDNNSTTIAAAAAAAASTSNARIIRRRFSTTTTRRRNSFKNDDNSNVLLLFSSNFSATGGKTSDATANALVKSGLLTSQLGIDDSGDVLQRRRSSFTNPRHRRQFRAASIDVPCTSSQRPVFTIGGISDECSQLVSVGSARPVRKASLDIRSRSLDVPEESGIQILSSTIRKGVPLTHSSAIIEQQGSNTSQDNVEVEDNDESGKNEMTTSFNFESTALQAQQQTEMDEMLAAQLSLEDDEISALLEQPPHSQRQRPQKETARKTNSLEEEDKKKVKKPDPDNEDQDFSTCNVNFATTSKDVKKFRNMRANALTSDIEASNNSAAEIAPVSNPPENVTLRNARLQPLPAPPNKSSSTSGDLEQSAAATSNPVHLVPGISPANHEDTSEGSVHLFQDESGEWMVYVFGDDTGIAMSRRAYLEKILSKKKQKHQQHRSNQEMQTRSSSFTMHPQQQQQQQQQQSQSWKRPSENQQQQQQPQPRCDSPHPDKMLVEYSSSLVGVNHPQQQPQQQQQQQPHVSAETRRLSFSNSRYGPQQQPVDEDAAVTVGDQNIVRHHNYLFRNRRLLPAANSYTDESSTSAGAGTGAVAGTGTGAAAAAAGSQSGGIVIPRRLSNVSMEQISMLDRILMTTDNSRSSTNEPFGLFQTMFGSGINTTGGSNIAAINNAASSTMGDGAPEGGIVGGGGGSGGTGALGIAGSAVGGSNSAAGRLASVGAIGSSSGVGGGGNVSGNGPGAMLPGIPGMMGTASSSENMMFYEAIEKWFLQDKTQVATKHYYYELSLLPWSDRKFRVNFDRLQLTALFDRSTSKFEIIFSVLLAGLVSLLGLLVITRQLYYDFNLWVACFAMAAAQYSLVKSVQPDACSPQHGFNRILVFNRAIYFCVVAGMILMLELLLENGKIEADQPVMRLYKIPMTGLTVTKNISYFFQYVLLFLPLLHTMGLLPQLNTILLFLLEQCDIHLFGASGSTDTCSAIFSLFRNFVAVGFVFPLCFFSLKSKNPQSIFLSIYWGLHLSLCYLLSRLPNSLELYHCFLDCCSFIYRPIRRRYSINRRNKKTHMMQSDIEMVDRKKKKNINGNSRLHKGGDGGSSVEVLGDSSNNSGPDDRLLSAFPCTSVLQQASVINTPTQKLTTTTTLVSSTNNNSSTQQPPQSSSSAEPLSQQQQQQQQQQQAFVDPLPSFIRHHIVCRIKNDLLMCVLWSVMGFALHISSLFTQTQLQWMLRPLFVYFTVAVGFLLHYLWSQLCKPYPWLLLTNPIIKLSFSGKVTKWEGTHYWILWLQKNVFIPLLVMNEFTNSITDIQVKFGNSLGAVIITVSSMKLLRCGFNASPHLYLMILLTHLLFQYDFRHMDIDEQFPCNFLLVSILFSRIYELWLKMNFVFIYIAPFQISWGSAFHAVAQLAFLPHSMFLITQCVLSSLLSAPLEPFLASAIFISSYVRPIKFWEKKYRTQRLETTNTALSSQVQGISSEQVAGNLNSIFYEHLTRSLQKTLAGDLLLGRWGGAVGQGDMFILASEDLHFLVHIIEMGNGLVTFQLRGLEFAGTYCHEQETEELRTDLVKNQGFCCYNPGRLPHCLSLNVAFRLRWVAWQFVQTPLVLEGYRVTDHSATTTVQLFELRRLVVTLFVQCIIYRTVQLGTELPSLLDRLSQSALAILGNKDFADLDPVFNKAFDDDFDEQISGVTRSRFVTVYGSWIKYCLDMFTGDDEALNSKILTMANRQHLDSLCFGLSLVGRRSLGYSSAQKISYQQSMTDVFLHGLHDVFKGDVRVSKDDWIFEEVTLLQKVITPAVRVALKLYQDNLANPLTAMSDLYSAIVHTENTHVICHETEPQWRFAILNDAESLFSFRRIVKPNSGDGYRIIMFNKKSLLFKVIKINRECVRGLWSSQQREQIFLRNNDQERGSIQHARQVLRNLVNSSCDLPIGYPIYVSPLTTSLAGSHLPLQAVAGRELSLASIFARLARTWARLRYRCSTESCVPTVPARPSHSAGGGGGGGGSPSGGRGANGPRCSIITSAGSGVVATGGGGGGGMDVNSDAIIGSVETKNGGELMEMGVGKKNCSCTAGVGTGGGGCFYHHHHHHRQQCLISSSTYQQQQQQSQLHYTVGNACVKYHNQRSASVDDTFAVGAATGATMLPSAAAAAAANTFSPPHISSTFSSSGPRPSLPISSGPLIPNVAPEFAKKIIYKISEGGQVLDRWHDKLQWPQDDWRTKLVTSKTSRTALQGQEGELLHRWTPFNPITNCRSFCHLSILLLALLNSGGVGGGGNDMQQQQQQHQELVLVFENGVTEVINEEVGGNTLSI